VPLVEHSSNKIQQPPFLLGVFLVTASSLALEVLYTRLLSVLTWYSLAFLVIAMGMFGLTAGAVWVYLEANSDPEKNLGNRLAHDCLRLAMAIPISYGLLLVVPLRVEPVLTTVFLFVVFAILLALPFVLVGRIVALALTRSPFPLGRVYAFDLAGAALGAPCVPWMLEHLGAGTAILSLSVVSAFAAFVFAASGKQIAQQRHCLMVGGIMLALCMVNNYSPRGLVPLWVKGRAEHRADVAHEAWNSHSRIQVSALQKQTASLWGPGNKCKIPTIEQHTLMIDADAATPLYHVHSNLKELEFLSCDVTNIAHFLRPNGPMAIIGVGGSRDIQSALLFHHKPIVGIEVNERMLQVLRGPLGRDTGVPRHPDVRLVHAEARSYLTRSTESFQLIQASLIDTWAATGAGAHALSENGLYTLEGWRIFLNRLQPDGIITFSRWSSVETLRLLSLASAALLDRKVAHPREHLALVKGGNVTTLLLSPSPLSAKDIKVLRAVADNKGFHVMLAPDTPVGTSPIDKILDAPSRSVLDSVSMTKDYDFRPPTDEKPFFFNVVRLGAFARSLPSQNAGTIEGNRMATAALMLSLFASLLLSLSAIVYPLYRRAKPQGRHSRQLGLALSYFALIGVGFMLAEIGLMQRLSLLLGHPNLSLIVVLSSLVGAAGVGSLLSDRLPLHRTPWTWLLPVALASLLVAISWAIPALAPRFYSSSLAIRVGLAVAINASLGFGLGMAFPMGMRIVSHHFPEESPWFWGVNGVGSVLASSLAMVIATTWGLRWLFLSSAACYLLLVPIVLMLQPKPLLAPSSAAAQPE
jgi:hypothetical protein